MPVDAVAPRGRFVRQDGGLTRLRRRRASTSDSHLHIVVRVDRDDRRDGLVNENVARLTSQAELVEMPGDILSRR